jgi:hypothetical protein
LQPKCPRDLETICLKCLRKEPPQRYPSCEALADDLRRFLAGEPIRARPVAVVERAWRWCRRNPRFATLGAAVGVLLLVVAASLGVLALRFNRERQAVAETRTVAEQRLQQATEAIAGGNYLRAQDLLRWSDPLLDQHSNLGDIRSGLETLKAQVDVTRNSGRCWTARASRAASGHARRRRRAGATASGCWRFMMRSRGARARASPACRR